MVTNGLLLKKVFGHELKGDNFLVCLLNELRNTTQLLAPF